MTGILQNTPIQIGVSERFQFISESTLRNERPVAQFREGFNFNNFMEFSRDEQGRPIGEFLSTGDISNQFFTRQEYEVEAGRQEVPLLYTGIYDVMTDANLPKTVEINTLGPSGVVCEDSTEGGEVKFASISATDKSIRMSHQAVGLEYTEDMFIYNQTWLFPGLERDFGSAWNAKQNHIHMTPILAADYTNTTTDGTTLTTFHRADQLEIKYLRTLERAIADSVNDQTNPRHGPYVLVTSTIDAMIAARALLRVPQQGVSLQTPAGQLGDAIGVIDQVVAYNGWSGSRGKKAVSYSGISAGTAYLVHIGHKRLDFQSKWKHQLRRQMTGPNLKRFILESIIWDARFGIYAAPSRAVQKITWPANDDGQAAA
jgi:hypothetical protein